MSTLMIDGDANYNICVEEISGMYGAHRVGIKKFGIGEPEPDEYFKVFDFGTCEEAVGFARSIEDFDELNKYLTPLNP